MRQRFGTGLEDAADAAAGLSVLLRVGLVTKRVPGVRAAAYSKAWAMRQFIRPSY
jgi:hypothetical protein